MGEKGVGMCRKLFGWGEKGGQARFPQMVRFSSDGESTQKDSTEDG